jgi:hypothetical protein
MPLSKILSASIASGAVSASNILEILSSPCNGTQVTVPSGTYTMPDITAVQSLSTSYADATGSSISYTAPSGTTRVIYRYTFNCQYDGSAYTGMHMKLLLDGTEVTDARQTIYGYYTSMVHTYSYTINCNADSANTAHGDITSWSGAKVMKMSVREYNSGNQAKLHQTGLWDGGSATQLIVPHLEIISLKDS